MFHDGISLERHPEKEPQRRYRVIERGRISPDAGKVQLKAPNILKAPVMIEDMTIRKLVPKTQQGYIRAIRNFVGFLGRSPDTARNIRRHGVTRYGRRDFG